MSLAGGSLSSGDWDQDWGERTQGQGGLCTVRSYVFGEQGQRGISIVRSNASRVMIT